MLHSCWCFQSIWKKMMMTDAIIGIYIHWTNPYWSYSVLLLFQLTINIHHLSHLEVRGSTFRRSSNPSPCMPSEKSSFYFKQLQLPCQDQRQHSNIKKILIFDFIDEGSTPFRSKNRFVLTHCVLKSPKSYWRGAEPKFICHVKGGHVVISKSKVFFKSV